MHNQTYVPKRFLWNGGYIFIIIIFFLFSLGIPSTSSAQAEDPTPPARVVKLIFIHHSTGENWLRDENGGLGIALSENNYFVSDTNYGWGPNGIGDRTDIVNWLEWFRSQESPRYLSALYSESEQHSPYTRLLSDPGGENEIILFKSCFPNSNLSGRPDDPAAAGDGLSVSNAKYIYNELLKYFATRPDKLFILITAPPVQDRSYSKNARAFNTWLVNDWLRENNYPYPNVAVFDFYNVLTGDNNHHRYNQGVIEYITDQGKDTSAYPTSRGDDHPSPEGNRKATQEFIPLLNIYYHRWKGSELVPSSDAPEPAQEDTDESDTPIAAMPGVSLGVIDDFESIYAEGEGWQFYFDEAVDSTVQCAIDHNHFYQGNSSLKIEYDIAPSSWGTCSLTFDSMQDWRKANGIGFYLHTDQAEQIFSLVAQGGTSENRTNYSYKIKAPPESISGWVYIEVPWEQFRRVEWEENAGSPFDPSQANGIFFGFDGLPETRTTGVIWVDYIHLLGASGVSGVGSFEPATAPTEQGQSVDQGLTPTSQPAAVESEQDQNSRGICTGIGLIPLPLLGLLWLSRRVKRLD